MIETSNPRNAWELTREEFMLASTHLKARVAAEADDTFSPAARRWLEDFKGLEHTNMAYQAALGKRGAGWLSGLEWSSRTWLSVIRQAIIRGRPVPAHVLQQAGVPDGSLDAYRPEAIDKPFDDSHRERPMDKGFMEWAGPALPDGRRFGVRSRAPFPGLGWGLYTVGGQLVSESQGAFYDGAGDGLPESAAECARLAAMKRRRKELELMAEYALMVVIKTTVQGKVL